MARGKLTEHSFYPNLLKIISSRGGSGVSEVKYGSGSVPDLIIKLAGRTWFLSVKIGETPQTLKDAFIQYLRHKEDTEYDSGLLLMLPESVRKVKVEESALDQALREAPVSILIDTKNIKEEIRDRTFPEVVDLISFELVPRIEKQEDQAYPLSFVITMLKVQVEAMIEDIDLTEPKILEIVTDRNLLTALGRMKSEESEGTTKFLAAYIILSQILFLRFLVSEHPTLLVDKKPITRSKLRRAFNKILAINYKPIYALDVVDVVPEKYLKDTFDLIWGLEVEKVRYELPGRIFHALMPSYIRKILAAFYTRPHAADILSHLAIERSDEEVFDPACGSGTILVSAYKAKKDLFVGEGRVGNPHKNFCENEIYGADIMPFAVHLTSANLATMDVGETLAHDQIIQGDSIRLKPGLAYEGSLLQMGLFKQAMKAKKTSGEEHDVELDTVDVVLMNPPFTKTERRIQDFVDMETFRRRAGGHVGLWGHFVFLADLFLKEEGTYGAVLPINVLRGTESERVRKLLLQEWTPLYILKPTYNYGFSEWAEYRDIIIICRKEKPRSAHRVKFCLIKKNLTQITEDDVRLICDKIRTRKKVRSEGLDIDSHSISDLKSRFINLMWFCGVVDFKHRDRIIKFYKNFRGRLLPYPEDYFSEGFRPVPKGVSKFLFLTRATYPSRIARAFLHFQSEKRKDIDAFSHTGVKYTVEKSSLVPSLRTSIGLETSDITDELDYLAVKPYKELNRVKRACGYRKQIPESFWTDIQRETRPIKTHIVTTHRINPYSPNTKLVAFVSDVLLAPSNSVNVVNETDLKTAKAVCVLMNSVLFFSQFFLLKEESTGRYINVRFYDLHEMTLYPRAEDIPSLAAVHDKYAHVAFPALREQFDVNFSDRYNEFWESRTGSVQQRLWSVLKKGVVPSPVRLALDLDVCKTLQIDVSEEDLLGVYGIFVKEMMITRRLTSD